MLEYDKDDVIQKLSEIKDYWLSLIEDIDDDTNYACYRRKYYTVSELIDLLDNTVGNRKAKEYHGQPYTFEEIYDEMVPDDEGPWQQVVDYWESEMLDYPEELY